jgi:hypothetical protein
MLSSRWEDPESAAAERRPVRRLYKITAAGEKARADAPMPSPTGVTRLNGRLASS